MRIFLSTCLLICAFGCRGERGPAGADAPAAPSVDGGSYEPRVWIGCRRALDLLDGATGAPGQDGLRETGLDYQATVYSNGDADIRCSASLGSQQSTEAGGYYPSITNGAHSGDCSAAVNFPDNGSHVGVWGFSLGSTGGPAATYSDDDPDNAWIGQGYTFTDADCTLVGATAAGGWKALRLADLSKM